MKVCNKCYTEKPDEDFELKYAKNLRHTCKECYRLWTIERQKKSYRKMKEKRLQYQKEYDSSDEVKELKREYGKVYRTKRKEKIKMINKGKVRTIYNWVSDQTGVLAFA